MHTEQHNSSQKATNTAPSSYVGDALPPSAIREKKAWLVWEFVVYTGEIKPRKIPRYADGGRRKGRQGSEADRGRLVTFETARDAAERLGCDGVGYALLPGDDIVALDVDNCVDAAGHLPEEILEIVSHTYSERSPSGKGVRAFFKGDLGNKKSPTTSTQYGFEVFSNTGYVTVTGNILPGTELLGNEDTIADIPDSVRELCRRRFGEDRQAPDVVGDDPFAGLEKPIGLTIDQIQALLDKLDADMGREDWIKIGMALSHECSNDDTGFDLWDEWSSHGVTYPSSEALKAQWESFNRHRPAGSRPVTMRTVIKMANRASKSQSGPQAATAEELEAAAAETPAGDPKAGVGTPEGFSGKFPAVSAGVLSRRPLPEWLIKGVVPKANVGILFGASGSGKSFMAMDMAGCVARAKDWRGRKTKKGRVLIIAAEGSGGVGKRLEAYAKHHQIDIDKLDIAVVPAAPNFLQNDDISEVAKTVKAAGGIDLIITDTFAQVTPGANENSAEDMGLALSNAKALSETTGALVLLIHHAGKDATRGARGWSGIKAAADVEIEIIKRDSGAREMRISKMKDGEDGLEFPFDLKVIELGVDGDGEKITSCVIEHTDRRSVSKSTIAVPKGENQKHVYNAAIANGANSEAGAKVSTVIDAAIKFLPHDPTAKKRDQRRNSVIRALTTLSDRDVLVVRDNHVYTPYYAPLSSDGVVH